MLVFLMTQNNGIIIQIILGFAVKGLLIYDVINPSGIVGIVVIIISVILGELLHFASDITANQEITIYRFQQKR